MNNRGIIIENLIVNAFAYGEHFKIIVGKDFGEARKIISELLLVFFGSPYAKHRGSLGEVLPAHSLNEAVFAGNTYR